MFQSLCEMLDKLTKTKKSQGFKKQEKLHKSNRNDGQTHIPFPQRIEMERIREMRKRGLEDFKQMVKELKVNKAFARMISQTSWF